MRVSWVLGPHLGEPPNGTRESAPPGRLGLCFCPGKKASEGRARPPHIPRIAIRGIAHCHALPAPTLTAAACRSRDTAYSGTETSPQTFGSSGPGTVSKLVSMAPRRRLLASCSRSRQSVVLCHASGPTLLWARRDDFGVTMLACLLNTSELRHLKARPPATRRGLFPAPLAFGGAKQLPGVPTGPRLLRTSREERAEACARPNDPRE